MSYSMNFGICCEGFPSLITLSLILAKIIGGHATEYPVFSPNSAQKAIDGNNYNKNVGSCSHTNLDEKNVVHYWQIDFGRNIVVKSVTVYNRNDCCWGRLSYVDIVVFNNGRITKCGTTGDMTYIGHREIACSDLILGSIVRVQHTSQQVGVPITLCEVYVFGREFQAEWDFNTKDRHECDMID